MSEICAHGTPTPDLESELRSPRTPQAGGEQRTLRSVVFDQAESRFHVQKAVMMLLLGGGEGRLSVRSAHA